MPFTLHVTLVLVALITVAVNVWEFPSRTEALAGVTDTETDGGDGGGGLVSPLVLPPPQPCNNVTAANSAMSCEAASLVQTNFPRPSTELAFVAFRVRGRMHGGMQAKGQRKEETRFGCESDDMPSDCLS